MHFARQALPCAALLLAAAAPIAHAAGKSGSYAAAIESASSAPLLDARVTLASQYVSRGIRRSGGRPALQAAIDYGRPEGWRAGAQVSTVDGRFVQNGSVETNVYAGYSRKSGEFGYNAKATWYHYPGARVPGSGGAFDYAEVAMGLAWKAMYAKYNVSVTPDFFGVQDARGTGYLDLGAKHDVGEALTLKLHAGDGHVAGKGNGAWGWRDMAAGLSTRLDDGWIAAVNLTRAVGGAGGTGIYERYNSGNLRADSRPWAAVAGRRSLVLSLTRKF